MICVINVWLRKYATSNFCSEEKIGFLDPWSHHYSMRKNIWYNFIKIVFHIWNLEAKSFSTSYYSTISSNLHFRGHFKVMANFDLDDLMTLKPSILWLSIQGLPCIPITASQLNWLLYKSTLFTKQLSMTLIFIYLFLSSILFWCPFTDILPLYGGIPSLFYEKKKYHITS